MDELSAVLDRAREVRRPVWAWADTALVDALDQVHTLAQRVQALRLELLREVDARGIPAGQGATATAAWLRDRHRISHAEATRATRLAASLDTDLPATAQALAAGAVNTEQVQVIASAVADLPAQHRGAGEAYLLAQAALFGPRDLGTLGQRLFDVIAPDHAEEHAHAALARAEQRAHRRRGLSLTDIPGTGQVRLTGWLDHEGAATVRAAIDSLTTPRRDKANSHSASPDGSGVPARTPGQRRADALVDICRLATAHSDLSQNGAERPTIVVTINFTDLRDTVGTATLDDGAPLSAATTRRLACDAAILPAILNGPSQPLDLGRQRRLITGPLRRALTLRDRGCAFPHCDRPPRWCDAHHITHWADGGPTALTNAVLLCRYHHRLIHHSTWAVRLNPTTQRPEFTPPAYIDPDQRPQRNHHHNPP